MVENRNGVSAWTGELRVIGTRARPGRFRLAGELDLGTRDLLLAVGCVSDHGGLGLDLDASELSFVDCAGLAALVALARSARADGVAFQISSASASLARLSHYAGTDSLLSLSGVGVAA